ncbi:hypothetical protein [uncultured Pseudomonas sp.]|uniref:hypothetical protein n=1 Tax=uncultured Pseudomonas sp. TaxID=114707 RepID=UPI0025F94E75|nr:hypothetical protein [uncultured Pseudomonas sp.]
MSIAIVEALKIFEVQNAGVANEECVLIQVLQSCDLAEYALILTMPTIDGHPVPVKDHFLWFGQGFVNQGDWVFVYTASGSTKITPIDGLSTLGLMNRLISIHWGKDHTIFQNRALSPVLIKIGAVGVLPEPVPAYQGNRGENAVKRRLF